MKFQANLSVLFLREKNRFVAYSPALDLSTSGKTFAEAKRRFGEAAALFFESLQRHGTTSDALEELGWQKAQRSWKPPVLVSQETESVRIPVRA